MFVGHIGVGLALARAERRVNLGVFVAAAVLLDMLLWLFILLGWESVRIPADFATTRQPAFDFPYSHGLLGALAWSVLAGAVVGALFARLGAARWRAAALVAAAVFSHWLLDGLVHRPELPLAGEGSLRVGLSLWDRLPLALTVEAMIALLGLAVYLAGAPLSRGRSIALAALTLAVLAFTVIGMVWAPPPPSALAMAASSLAVLVVLCLLFGWLGQGASA